MKKNNNKIGIKNYLSKYKFGIFIYILFYVFASIFDIAIVLLLADAVEKVTIAQYMSAIYIFLIIMGCKTLRRGCWVATGFIYQKYAKNIMAELNLDLAKQAFKLNSETYSNYDTGTFVQRIVFDPERIVNNLVDIVDYVTSIISSTIIIVYISTLSIYIGLIIVALIAVCMIFEIKRHKEKVKNRKISRRAGDKINSLTTEIVRSEKDIKSIGLEDKLSEVSKNYYQEYKRASYKTEMVDMALWSSRSYIIEIFSLVILILGVVLLDKALLTFAAFMIVYSNTDGLYNLVWSIGNVIAKYSDIKVCSDRMFALFNDGKFTCEKFGDTTLNNIVGEIEFKNVGYSYKEYEKDEKDLNDKSKKTKKSKKKDNKENSKKLISVNKIFENLNFKIEPNTTVAFVGKSGSGKSTILNLMSKMHEVDEGEVLIDGVNINNLTKQSLRNSISLVNQFPYIFDMTIKENLLLAKKDATDEELQKAIKDASFDEFVNSLKDGIDTKVGESGVKLSGGQKQRLAIARALLRNSSIIIFDESTSSLDNFAQENIKRSIDNLKGKSTVVIVAHRLSTIKNVDKIFFLDEGKIVDSGTFDYLFENNNKFRNMFLAENI